MKNCIDCGIKLTKENRSIHQPKIRCTKCFEVFADGVEETLENMLKETSFNENKSS